jgi:hypothetical protein
MHQIVLEDLLECSRCSVVKARAVMYLLDYVRQSDCDCTPDFVDPQSAEAQQPFLMYRTRIPLQASSE